MIIVCLVSVFVSVAATWTIFAPGFAALSFVACLNPCHLLFPETSFEVPIVPFQIEEEYCCATEKIFTILFI